MAKKDVVKPWDGPIVELTSKEFNALLEYSSSLPTGTTIGKKWKRGEDWDERKRAYTTWFQGEYYDIEQEGKVGIRWSLIRIRTMEIARTKCPVKEKPKPDNSWAVWM